MTVRYLGIEVDDVSEISEQTEISRTRSLAASAQTRTVSLEWLLSGASASARSRPEADEGEGSLPRTSTLARFDVLEAASLRGRTTQPPLALTTEQLP